MRSFSSLACSLGQLSELVEMQNFFLVAARLSDPPDSELCQDFLCRPLVLLLSGVISLLIHCNVSLLCVCG